MKKGFLTLLLLIITALPAMAAPGNTSGPWGIWIGKGSGFTSLSTAKRSPVTAGKTMVVDSAMPCNNLTMAEDRDLDVKRGGGFTVAAGKTLNMNGATLTAGRYQIFFGSGTVIGLKDVKLEWFGGKGDGSTDNTSAIQKASNAAKYVSFSAGTYIIKPLPGDLTHAVILTSANDGLKWSGKGKATIIKAETAGTAGTYFYMVTLIDAKNISFDNISFDGNASSAWASNPATPLNGYHAIWLTPTVDYGVSDIDIRGCYFTGTWDSAVQSYGGGSQTYPLTQDHHFSSRYIKVTDSRFRDVGAHGVGMNEWDDSSVTASHFYHMGRKVIIGEYGSGIAVDVSGGCNRVIVADNVSEGGIAGFKAETHTIDQPGHPNNGQKNYSTDVTFDNNTVKIDTYFYAGYGIKLAGKGCKAVNNTIKSAYIHGINVTADAVDAIVSHNTIKSVTVIADGANTPVAYGIRADGLNTKVTNNNVTGVTGITGAGAKVGYGISTSSDNTTISGNTVYNNPYCAGVRVAGTRNTKITNNDIYDNGDAAGTYFGLSIVQQSAILPVVKPTVTGNTIYNSSGSNLLTAYAIYAPATEVYDMIEGNNHIYNMLGAMYAGGTLTAEQQHDNKTVRAGSVPTTGTYTAGDRWLETSPAAGASPGGVCVTSGTILSAALTGVTADATNGSKTITITAPSAAELQKLKEGQYITVGAVLTSVKIERLVIADTSATTATAYVSTAASGNATAAAVSHPAFTFKPLASIGS